MTVQKGYDRQEKLDEWLFKNHMNTQFTRQGINYLVSKYAKRAWEINPEIIPKDFNPHKMRHTVAMGLVDSGVDLIYIRDLLGHVSVKTTEAYYGKRNIMESKLANPRVQATTRQFFFT